VDPEAAAIQSDETPETTLDRTRHLIARSRQTLEAANRRLNNAREHDHESSSGDRRDSLS
jgi:hypothetical protein